MDKNYYDILGVDKNASEADIKKAYRKLAAKYHPDRQANKTDKEKAEAETMFKNVTEAYETLSDPAKRQQYDNPSPFDAFFGGGTPDDFFNMFTGGPRRQPNVGASINITQYVDIKDIYCGTKRILTYGISTRCASCNGVGGKCVRTCPQCNGAGVRVYRTANMIQQTTCPQCMGAGKVVDGICDTCHGSGMITREVQQEVYIPPFTAQGYKLYFSGKGSESKVKGGQNGDLFVQVIYKFDTTRYKISNNVITELVPIPYYLGILGGTIDVTLPDNKVVKVTIPQCSHEYDYININSHYGIQLFFETPSRLNGDEKTLLEQIQQLHK